MANYWITNNAKFRPFSYDEMIRPVEKMYTEHKGIEEGLAELQTKAGIWEGLANEQTDPVTYAQYKRYADELRMAADDLAMNGLNARSRQNLYNMKARYASEITPIERAYTSREERRKLEEQALLKDPTLLIGTRANQRSLDEYIGGSTPDYNAYSGAMITQQVATQMQHLANRLTKAKLSNEPLDQYTNLFLKSYGLTPDQVLNAINDPDNPNNLPIIKTVVDNVLGSTGVNKWGDDNTKARAKHYAYQGVFSGIGKEDAQAIDNYAARKQLEFQHASALQAQKHRDNMEEAAYAAYLKGQQEGGNNGETERGMSFLQASGNLAGYETLKGKLFHKEGGLSSAYFGKTGKANPMQVYNEIISLTKKLDSKTAPYSKEDLYRGSRNTGLEKGSNHANNYMKAKEQIMKKYGVTKVLSEAEYKQLKDLGYTTNSNFNDFRYQYGNKVDALATKTRHSSVNLFDTGLESSGQTLAANISFAFNQADNKKQQVWEINKDGSLGKPITDLKDVTKDVSKMALNDIYYSQQNSDKLHVVIDNKHMYINPYLLGDEVGKVVSNANSLLKLSDDRLKRTMSSMCGYDLSQFNSGDLRDLVRKQATNDVRDILRAQNQGRSKTSKDI